MSYIKGGRGKQAPYKTTHCRVPEDCKPVVDLLTATYKQLVDDPNAAAALIRDIEKSIQESYSKSAGLQVEAKTERISQADLDDVCERLESALKLPANKGGAIKSVIKDVLNVLRNS